MKLNRDQYDRLNAEIEKEFNDGIDLDESKIEIKLVNDQRKPVEMISSSVFIDNKPVLNPMLKLGKRKSVDIKFSNVHSAHFDEYNEVELFKLKMWSTFNNSFKWIYEFVITEKEDLERNGIKNNWQSVNFESFD